MSPKWEHRLSGTEAIEAELVDVLVFESDRIGDNLSVVKSSTSGSPFPVSSFDSIGSTVLTVQGANSRFCSLSVPVFVAVSVDASVGHDVF
jgi:hypothetical protein